MARSTYYYHTARLKPEDHHAKLRSRIRKIYSQHYGRYGYRRITLQLRTEEKYKNVNHKTVQKLMAQMGLQAVRKRQKYRSYKGDVGSVAPNIIDRNFVADNPLEKWTTDVTQVKIKDRNLYLSPILDMFNGEIIYYTISGSPNLKMVIDMLNGAFAKHKNLKGLIFHSDQGWHYQHREYQNMLKEKGIRQSMSRKGNCLDNSVMENFFGIMKNELFYPNEWDSIEQFEVELRKYIKYYNNNRIKLRLNGYSPVKYRRTFKPLSVA